MAGPTRLSKIVVNVGSLYTKHPPSVGARCYMTLAQRSTTYPGTTAADRQQRQTVAVCQASTPAIYTTRTSTSFFNKLTAEQLWKGVTSVSNAGKKQGRGSGVGRKIAKNLNRGQVIGVGSENMVWPGLNAPVVRGKELVRQQLLLKDEEREAKLKKIRDTMGKFRVMQMDPLDRGWSGRKMGGRSAGPPDPIGEDAFEGFDTKILELKMVVCMTAVFGRKRRLSAFVVTGNGNGVAGFALAKANTAQAALRKAKNKAGQKLLYINRYQNHTVLHDFFSQYGSTKIFVKKVPEGYGLVCHRAIRTICETIGIKDIYAKVEGSTKNYQNLTKAFFLGLLQQKSHQQLADQKQLHLVEFREETHNFPTVVASPQTGPPRLAHQIPKHEELDFNMVVMDGKLPLKKKKYPPGYVKLPSYNIYLKKYSKKRNQEKVRVNLLVDQGELCSFYTPQYPECSPNYGRAQEMEEEAVA